MMKSYRFTMLACYNGYITQAIAVNLAPLLYLTFQKEYDLTLTQIGLLIAVNFSCQLTVDLLCTLFGDRLNLRAAAIFAHVSAAAGLAGMGYFPLLLPDAPYAALIGAMVLFGVGGGLTEVIISPLMEACPTEEKSSNMSFLHSFYSWGQAGVVLFSSLFFLLFDIHASWRILSLLWAIVPVTGIVAFSLVPIYKLPSERDQGVRRGTFFRSAVFAKLVLMMICAGACEMIMSEWASSFAESALGVSKRTGDLFGPFLFAVMMGISRVGYGKMNGRRLIPMMKIGCVVCIVAYLVAAFVPIPAVALAGCALCGLGVGIFWPGTLSYASSLIPTGGVPMFSFLALSGDIGCLAGPSLAGKIADLFGGHLEAAFCFAAIFPLFCLMTLTLGQRKAPQ